jgi:hypothetical protein
VKGGPLRYGLVLTILPKKGRKERKKERKEKKRKEAIEFILVSSRMDIFWSAPPVTR